MKTASAISLLLLTGFALACGYSAKATPPAAGAVPAIQQLQPASATAGGPAFNMIVNGTNFGSKAVVNWNGNAQTANTTFVSGNQLTVAVPASLITTSGTAQITVTNPGTSGTGMYGTGATLPETSAPMNFTVN